MKSKPLITVAVVCLNEENNISDCLRCLLTQSFPAKKFEILVVDNQSIDNTLKLIRQMQKSASWRIKLVINPKRGIAASRNVAVRLAQGKYLAFTDADCQPRKNWLANLLAGYSKYKADDQKLIAVGGPNNTPLTTPFYRALRVVLNSFLGSRGSIQSRYFLTDRPVPHIPCVNVLFIKKKLKEIGGFDERLGSVIEDEDVTYRLAMRGYHFYYLAKAIVIHKKRPDLRSWAGNMFVYGKGRIWFLLKYPKKWHPYFLAPILLVLGVPILLPIYLPLIGLYSFWIAIWTKSLKLTGRIFLILVTIHLFYGAGEIYGLFINRLVFTDQEVAHGQVF
jgi:glycosyltransferase involved in cell wall biosynthesis